MKKSTPAKELGKRTRFASQLEIAIKMGMPATIGTPNHQEYYFYCRKSRWPNLAQNHQLRS